MEWNEVFYLLVPSTDDSITLELMSSATAVIGRASIPINELTSSPITNWYPVANAVSGKSGELNLGFQYFPILDTETSTEEVEKASTSKASSSKGKETVTASHVPEEFHSGVLHFTIHGAKNIVRKEANIMYEVTLLRNGVAPPPVTHLAHYDPNVIRSHLRKQSSAPTWEESYELLIADPNTDSIVINFMTKSGNVMTNLVKESHILGGLTVRVSEVLGRNEWFDLGGGMEGAKMHASFTWRPIGANLELTGGIIFVPPIGVLDLKLDGEGISACLISLVLVQTRIMSRSTSRVVSWGRRRHLS